MSNIFIKKVTINNVRHLKDLEINLSNTHKKHLIITGRNGSGKTSLLYVLRDFLGGIQNNQVLHIPEWKKNIKKWEKSINKYEGQLEISINEKERIRLKQKITDLVEQIESTKESIAFYNKIKISINHIEEIPTFCQQGKFIIAFFGAQRGVELKSPSGIQKLEMKSSYNIHEKANQDFIQYLVNLKAQRSFARDSQKEEVVKNIDEWFFVFENFLKEVFEDERLGLEFDSENFNFNIILPNRETFNFSTLSDGYSAIMNIVTELILRMENKSAKNYEIEGIVLIDEAESHLHIDLQKKLLPFLTKVFPKIQFVVTTHSPFIINSLENAVIYDLENYTQVEDLSGYSVEGIIEGYFKSDKYSDLLKGLLNEYETLVYNQQKDADQIIRFNYLKSYFKDLSKFMSPELKLRVQQLEFKNLEQE